MHSHSSACIHIRWSPGYMGHTFTPSGQLNEASLSIGFHQIYVPIWCRLARFTNIMAKERDSINKKIYININSYHIIIAILNNAITHGRFNSYGEGLTSRWYRRCIISEGHVANYRRMNPTSSLMVCKCAVNCNSGLKREVQHYVA